MDQVTYTTRTTCRVCASADLVPLFSLGTQFVSDFVPADKIHAGHRCPIELELCRSCTLVQAKHTAPQDFLYTRHYWYTSGVTQTMRDALKDITEAAQRTVNLQPGDVVLDIGSNDGTLLRSYTAPGIVRVGCEPAVNLAEQGRVGVDCLIQDFWTYTNYAMALYLDKASGRWERLPKAKVITAIGMAYDLEEPGQFVADIAKALAPDGVCIWQLMCLKQTVEKGDVGNFAHEHLEYYSLLSLEDLFEKHGLEVFDIAENNINGGSYRVYVQHKDGPHGNPYGWDRISAALMAEAKMRLDDPATYTKFFADIRYERARLSAFLRNEVEHSKRVHVLGASTKGNVLLQWYDFDHRWIEAASERSPSKCGLFTIGTGIPIVSEEQSRQMLPDYYLLLPYAFADEMMEREREFAERGGKFIVPLPELRVI
jgi:NDP-4-keto-2,6-dideoxyhexose 3-C-methyltransferase